MLCRIVLETDANVIAGKVASNSLDAAAPLTEQVIFGSVYPHSFKRLFKPMISGDLNRMSLIHSFLQTISQAFATAREHLTRSLLK